MYHLLSSKQTKMDKSTDYGFYSVALHLEPAYEYKGHNTCPWSGQCKGFCLANAGRMRFPEAVAARIRRTQLFYDDRSTFFALLAADIMVAQRKAEKAGLTLTVRLNGTSDIAWETLKVANDKSIFDMFPHVQFIDYTKSEQRALDSVTLATWPKNYKVVYSWNERTNPEMAREILLNGGNVAMVFDVKKGQPLPKETVIDGVFHFPVVDGDHNDLRHLDPKGTVVGLRYKLAFKKEGGSALKPKKGFIILNNNNALAA